MNHLTAEEIAAIADGEVAGSEHLRDCAACANAVLGELRMKRAVREAAPRYEVPATLVKRLQPRRSAFDWLLPVAAALAIVVGGGLVLRWRAGAPAGAPPAVELVDLHTTLLASSNPVDVVSTDRHTVKPWFEGRVPFAVPVPELAPPFRLIGGRVVYWRQQPGAYLMIAKGAHRISLFIFRDDMRPTQIRNVASEVWTANGLTFVALADVSQEDLRALREAFSAGR